MLTTEAEAKTKRCHEAFAASQGITADGSVISSPVPMVSHSAGYGGSFAVQTASAPMYCLGSACMAWRWGKVINVYEPIEKRPDGSTFIMRQELGGYCGKAGKPVQLNMEDAP